MSGLTSALSNALSGLLVTSGQSAIVSRNVTNANDENYTRKQVSVISNLDGSARLTSITRASEKGLLDSMLKSSSDAALNTTKLSALQTLSATVGDVQSDGSIAWSIDQLKNNLQSSGSDPANLTLANQVITSAKTLAQSLNDATATVQNVRGQADQGIAASVGTINDLLGQFQKLDAQISSGGTDSADLATVQDSRDTILKSLSSEIGIRTTLRGDGSMAIYTDGGVTLYDRSVRSVIFTPTPVMTAGTQGQQVFADGVPITGAASPMASKTGKLVALSQIRDTVAPTYQNQLDDLARSLVTSFAEKDQANPATLPDATGLFSYSGSPAVPLAAPIVVGLAGQIAINGAFDRSAGGNPNLLRDGGANGSSYLYNNSGVSGFQSRLAALLGSFNQQQNFSSSSLLSTSNTITGFATQSSGWLEGLRAAASDKATTSQATMNRAKDALLRTTGVNLDQEMATMLSIEQSYQASAKVMTTVNQMYTTLTDIVR